MMVHVYKSPNNVEISKRLQRLNVPFQEFTSESILDLSHDSSDQVYFVDQRDLEGKDWALLRVRMAQANRYYIVAGPGLSSVEIVNAVRDGAYDVLLNEDSDNRWREAIDKVVNSQALWMQIYGGKPRASKEALIGESPPMRSLRQAIERLGPTNASVLIMGESGVGKELVANALHKVANQGPFVAVNCAAIPKDLIEAELFGAEKGAYTGALKTRPGLVEQAATGTLFLDEIGELDIQLQPKLLRFLETRRFRRVGGDKELSINVRVLSATNRNLGREVDAGQFRADLYFRLSEIILRVPPLRQRPEDIPLLAQAFLMNAGERFGKHFEGLEPELARKLQNHTWPGNVRELKSAIDRLAIWYDGPLLRAGWWKAPLRSETPGTDQDYPSHFQDDHDVDHRGIPDSGIGSSGAPSTFPQRSQSRMPVGNHSAPAGGGGGGGWRPGGFSAAPSRKQKLEMARQLLEESGESLTWVAAQLGIHPTTLYRWRKENKI